MHDLTAFTTLKLPFKAQAVLQIKSKKNIASSISQVAHRDHLILSGGSNVVALDSEFDGVVIRPEIRDWDVSIKGDLVFLEVGAGHVWHDVVMNTLAKGWFGLENLALIPGWVGAAPIQNIGAYGVELKDHCHSVTVYDFEQRKLLTLDASDLQFSYRHSILKDNPGRFLVVSVTVGLSTKAIPRVEYEPILQYIQDAGGDPASPLDIANAVIKIRKSKLPDPERFPNVGSFFKNPVVCNLVADRLKQEFPDMPTYQQGHQIKLAAGWMIDHVGLRGLREGGFKVHEKQALVLINQREGKVEDLRRLVSLIRRRIKETFGVILQIEPTQIGQLPMD